MPAPIFLLFPVCPSAMSDFVITFVSPLLRSNWFISLPICHLFCSCQSGTKAQPSSTRFCCIPLFLQHFPLHPCWNRQPPYKPPTFVRHL